MINNLQANSLNVNFNSYIVSKKFKVPKKLTDNCWLKLDTKELKVLIANADQELAKAKLIFKDGYFFLDSKVKPSKLKKEPIKKSEAVLKIEFNRTLQNGLTALDKMPISAILHTNSDYQAEIYYSDMFYIKVKDRL